MTLTSLKGRNGAVASLLLSFLIVSCNGTSDDSATWVGGSDSKGSIPGGGQSCEGSSDICLGVKYVSYVDNSGSPVVSQSQAMENIQKVNQIWKQCGIAFQLEEYQAVNASDYGLPYGGAAAQSQTVEARRAFDDGKTFLILTTGPWNVSKNAWTATPGSAPYGAIVEASGKTNANIIAHELGHYLDLPHINVNTNLLSTVIYPNSTQLSANQCAVTQDAAHTYWPHMLR